MLDQHPNILATGKLRDFPCGEIYVTAKVYSCGTLTANCSLWLETQHHRQPVERLPDRERLPRLFGLVTAFLGQLCVGVGTHIVGYAQLLHPIDGVVLYRVQVLRDGRAAVCYRIRKDLRTRVLEASGWQWIRLVARVARRWPWHRQYVRLQK